MLMPGPHITDSFPGLEPGLPIERPACVEHRRRGQQRILTAHGGAQVADSGSQIVTLLRMRNGRRQPLSL
jgi:hypothetical protein